MTGKIKKWIAGVLGGFTVMAVGAPMGGCADKAESKSENAFYLLGNVVDGQMMGLVVQTKTKTIVIDGGATGAADQLIEFLEEKANMHVDAWFFTHPHHDHIGAFYTLFNPFSEYPKVTIDKIYHHFPSQEMLQEYGYRNANEASMWTVMYDLFDGDFAEKTQVIEQGDEFVFDGVTLSVLRVFNPEITTNFVNNSSAAFRIESEKASFLILGDLGTQGGDELKEICPLEKLQADYTQMAHHGQGGCSQEFYEYIQPKKCIWPTPDWLWRNDDGGGFDTGPWETVRTREWMQKIGVTKNYVAKDGTQKIEF